LNRDQTAEMLLAVARTEFLCYGFEGTDVTRIARSSGVAPNTFYRFFKDKTAAFVAVYLNWAAEERCALEWLIRRPGSINDCVSDLIAIHSRHPFFRRSLRRLAHEDRLVGKAVADARLMTLRVLRNWLGVACPDLAVLAADLIQLEFLAVAMAEGDVRAMDMEDVALRERAAAIFMRWRIRPALEQASEATPLRA